ncbi:hypothetical protein Efla_004894 [Eimeria flavescens]
MESSHQHMEELPNQLPTSQLCCSVKAIGPLCNPLSPIQPYPAANEAYCSYVSTIQKLLEGVQPQAIPPAGLSIHQDFPDIQIAPTTLPPPRNHQRVFPSTPTLSLSWASPAFFVSKNDGELQLVVDYSGLNSQAQQDEFPLPILDIIIDKLIKSKVLSRLNLRNGFSQIRTADGDIFKTFYSSPVGFFEWTVMLTGLINPPASFQRVMSALFKDLQFKQVYMDDIVVHSTTLSSHHDHL